MREILFRGAQKVDGAKSLIWYEGSLIIETDSYTGEKEYYIQNENGSFLVIPETVGQYTGLTDKNGKKIFEGDIVHGTIFSADCKGIIIWVDEIAGFGIRYSHRSDPTACENSSILKQLMHHCTDEFSAEVIGNIHNNSELLKEAENE